MAPQISREARISRQTNETTVELKLNLDGTGRAQIQTGQGFFDHMLEHIARHGLLDMELTAKGDLHVDAHHTVEDVGICLGKAILEAVGEPEGLARFGHALVPMDETLAEAAVDFSGRPYLVFNAALPLGDVGGFDAELAEEFFYAVAMQSRITLHIELRRGRNLHHCLEGLFKAFGRALRFALERDPRVRGVPSTKGMLET
ncbi:MAG TPA: imidazoleglycerol-phosphate dehydratase HisB [Candidatus Hydrogenedentes bacterium]|nr:imidazoleglycerol-phosphate dehydratase HisB [Candidatus Hydrogenedentota bacterium]